MAGGAKKRLGARRGGGLGAVVLAVAWLAALASGSEARAERGMLRAPPPGQRQPEAPGQAVPPTLRRFVEAEYPPAALAEGREATVVLRLEVDTDGRVSAAEVLEPAGHGFDEAALAAVRRFELEPARVGATPTTSSIVYRYRFVLEEASPEPVEEVGVLVRGLVLDLDRSPVSGARVEALGAEGPEGSPAGTGEHSAETDEEGRFALGPVLPGYYEVLAVAPGFVPYRSDEPTPLHEGRELTVRLQAEGSRYETVVRARRPREQMISQSLDRRELSRVPGSGGDPLRVIQNLPGLARTPAGLGLLVVRGSAPGDTLTVLESVGIPLLYHFGGLTSVISPRLLESIEFTPGNYPVRYGGGHGGLVEVRLRELQQEPFVGWHGDASIDLIDAQASFEGPITRGLAFAVAARRSHIGDVAAPLLERFEDSLAVTTAPVYWDYQGILQWTPRSEHFLRAIAFGSDDSIRLVVRAPADAGQTFTGAIGTHTYFHGGILQYRYRPLGPLSFDLTASVRHVATRTSVAQLFELDLDDTTFEVRPEVVLRAGSWGRFTLGVQLWVDEVVLRLTAPRPDLVGAGCTNPVVRLPEERSNAVGPAAYVEARLRPFERLTITSGVLVDLYDRLNRVGIEPRLWLRYEVTEGTTLEGGLGLFHQAASAIQVDPVFGNPGLRLESAVHYGVGIEQRILPDLSLSVSAFYKHQDQLGAPSSRVVERFGRLVPLRYESTGIGRAYGLETLLRLQPTGRFFGWLAYTLMRAERRDAAEEPWYLFAFDQTHILTLVAGVDLGRGWEVGLRFQLASGRPTTPVVGAVYDADCDSFTPVLGSDRSERLPMFHQLDLRVDKTWTVRDVVRIGLYLDIQNVYYHANTEAYFYSYDYSRRYPIAGLPILPTLGLSVEF